MKKYCPECGSKLIIDDGFVFCINEDCGYSEKLLEDE